MQLETIVLLVKKIRVDGALKKYRNLAETAEISVSEQLIFHRRLIKRLSEDSLFDNSSPIQNIQNLIMAARKYNFHAVLYLSLDSKILI